MSQELTRITPVHFRIERAREKEDANKVVSILSQCSNDLLEKGYDYWKNAYPLDEVLEMVRKCDVRLAYDGDTPVGTFTLHTMPKKYLVGIWETIGSSSEKRAASPIYMMALGILPERQREGIGKKLCEIAEGIALEKGHDGMRLDTVDLNNGFFLKMGYEIVNERRYENFRYAHVFFEKMLGSGTGQQRK